jgi:SAM-dependent methyltransferase
MILMITSAARPATDLGFLLHKHPGKAQSFDISAGQAHVFYPEAGEDRCTAALLLEVDPVGLVRGRRPAGPDAFSLAQYVNDRPYAASSMMAVALARVFRTAMAGRCAARPELAASALPLEIEIPALPCDGGAGVAGRLFGPLGWSVEARSVPLDPLFPQWGDSRYVGLRLSGQMRLADALSHLYVLLPVLDNAKHYWVSTDEVDKLIRAGAGWLGGHPERDLITRRYLAHQRDLVLTAAGRLAEADDMDPEALDGAAVEDGPGEARPGEARPGEAGPGEARPGEGAGAGGPGEPPPRRLSLAAQRRGAVVAVLRAAGAATVADLGCGEGALVRMLLDDSSFRRVLGVDVSHRALETATRRLHLDRMPERQRQRVELVQSSLTYRDKRIAGFDAAVLMEVIEHVDPPRLGALEAAVFGSARPATVVVTTPNAEHNVLFADLPPGSMRHRDHRFEWTRAQFSDWAGAVAARRGYGVRYLPVGASDPGLGPPTQMAVFTRHD